MPALDIPTAFQSFLPFIVKNIYLWVIGTSLVAQSVKNLPALQKTQIQSLVREDPLEKDVATHSSILVWEIKMQWPWPQQDLKKRKRNIFYPQVAYILVWEVDRYTATCNKERE